MSVRLILPQVQAIRDCLDGEKLSLVVTNTELSAALNSLKRPPDLVVCDSQVVHEVNRLTPSGIPMTTFSILMARFNLIRQKSSTAKVGDEGGSGDFT